MNPRIEPLLANLLRVASNGSRADILKEIAELQRMMQDCATDEDVSSLSEDVLKLEKVVRDLAARVSELEQAEK